VDPAPEVSESPLQHPKIEEAAFTALLLLHWEQWSHRRTETITFINDVHARRAHTVDFTISPNLVFGHDAIFSPLALIEKRTLRNFDLRGAAGEALPMLTAQENAALGRVMLEVSAAAALGVEPEAVKDALGLKEVLDIAADPPAQATTVVAALEEGRGEGAQYTDLLTERDVFFSLANDLARNFVMYAVMPAGGVKRRLVKFAYDEQPARERLAGRGMRRAILELAHVLLDRSQRLLVSVSATPLSDDYWDAKGIRGFLGDCWNAPGRLRARLLHGRERLRALSRRALEAIRAPRRTLGAVSKRLARPLRWLAINTVDFRFPAPYVWMSESYHVEIAAPDDLVIDAASLYRKPEPGQPVDAGIEFLCEPVQSTDRAHLSTRNQPRGTAGEILVQFRVRSSRILLAARNLSWATTGVFAGGLVLHAFGVPSHPGVASLLLVALPGVYATYLARPGAHRLVQQLVRGVQVIVGTQAVLSFGAAASLAVGLGTGWRVGIWGTCLFVSTLGSLAMWLANRRSARTERGESAVTG
jgi:hypothetical protein